MPGTAQIRRPSGGSTVHPEERKAKGVSTPDKLATSVMASTFRIPKRKSPEDKCTQMESPLSRLQDSHDQKMQWTRFSDNSRRSHGCSRPVNGNLSSNRSRMSPGSCNVGRSRPKRASDTLCQGPWRDGGSWRSGPQGRGLDGAGGLDRRRPLMKDTTLPLRERERATPEGLKRTKTPSRNDHYTTAGNKEERRKDVPVRRNGEGSRNGAAEKDDGGQCVAGQHRGSVLQHSDRGPGGTPKRHAAELQGRPRSTGSTSGSDRQTPPRHGDGRPPPPLAPSSQPKKAKLSPSELIVLSSDDGEDEDAEPGPAPPQVRVVAPRTETQSDLRPEEESEHDEHDEFSAQAVGEELVSPLVIPGLDVEEPTDMPSFIDLAFSALYVGTLRAESNGNISITNDSITIPLKDSAGVVEVAVALVTSELRRYGIWDGGVLEPTDGPSAEPTPSLLFLWVSPAQARLLQVELSAIHPVPFSVLASPFLLISLRDNLESLHGLLLKSFMEVLALQCGIQDLMQPITWSEGVALIHSSGHHGHLLSLLGQEPDQLDPDQLDPDQLDPDELDPDELDPEELDPEELDPEELDPEELDPEELDPEEVDPEEVEPETEAQEETEPHCSPAERESPAPPKPAYTVRHCRIGGSYSVSLAPRPGTAWSRYKHQGPPRRLILFPPPPSKGGITVTTEDLECLDSGEFLNDVIIDFYLKYLMLEKAPRAVAERSHVFSSFFYKQLTRKDNVSEETSGSGSSAQHRRHQRVRTWTRHVDIFSKDYLFVPVNQEAHWYLVVVCFPGLLEPQSEGWSRENSQDREPCGKEGYPWTPAHSVPECTQLGCKRGTVCKRPCILVMNSLKLSYHERVLKLVREYLQVEWEVRRKTPRDFTPEQMKGSQSRVPLQDNSSDCGLYLLQYVESFLQNPVVHFDLPVQLEHWFPRRQIRSKRDEIRQMVLRLHSKQQGSGR
ncbi:uncharacterized protein LOC133117096 isoform X2 [Conger conger]|uniref:uncharacterized protein LOC133117096 isoform X2 n=1 Tax=Conger conger TaxID=82655 RepID=UPI002A5A838C|nr:uncharacterized protein LOC133117096 isoform X2 [Conger conger]